MNGSLWPFNCAHCGKPGFKEVGAYNRAKKKGAALFCDKRCCGLSRRTEKSREQKVEEKRLYDLARRERLREELKLAKAAYHRRTYDPTKAREQRKLKMPRHIEYCRQPAYREKKAVYDRQRRAKLEYGEFWEAALILSEIESEVIERASRYDISITNGTLNKKQSRRREHEKSISG